MLSRVACVLGAAIAVAGVLPAYAIDGNPLRGVVRAINEAAISTDLATKIISLPFRDGDSFKKDDVLVEFDCERLNAEVKGAEADLRGHRAAWENSARLYQLKAAGAHDVSIAAAAHDKSAAVVEGLRARVKQCKIIAPFDGRVAETAVRLHETPVTSQPLIKIVDDRQLEIDMLLPAASLKFIQPGTPFNITLDETGQQVRGKMIRIGAAIDVVSQTFKATGVPESFAEAVLPGMSGTVSFSPSAQK